MRVAIRVDASREIGLGHAVRCLALADALRSLGSEVVFLCQTKIGDAHAQIREAGFACRPLSECSGIEADAAQTAAVLDSASAWDWLVVDHYALDARWGQRLRSRVRHLMAIDDLANRPLECDLLLDQNLHAEPRIRYDELIPPACMGLLGPHYALLRPEFAQTRAHLAPRQAVLERVLVCLGGGDAPNATEKVLDVLGAFPALQVTAVIGAANPHWADLQACWGTHPQINLVRDAHDMARRMADADLFIGAGGSMTWERAVLGLPGITVAIAENQRALSQRLAEQGAGIDLGHLDDFRPQTLIEVLRGLIAEPARLLRMGAALSLQCDGHGALRVAEAMYTYRQ